MRRININSDPLVRATKPVKLCKNCGRSGHAKRSCRLGRDATEDDILVNNILITSAESDNRVEEASQEMGDEDLEPEDEVDDEAEGSELSEEIEIFTSLINGFMDVEDDENAEDE